MQYKMYAENIVAPNYCILKITSPVESKGKQPLNYKLKYFVEYEENCSNGKYNCIADECLSAEAAN